MFAVADTALDGLVLELLLHGVGVGVLGLVLGILTPVGAETEDDVLADRRGIGLGTGAILLRQTKLGPGLAFRYAGVDDLTVCNHTNTAGCLDLLAILVESICDCGFRTVLVLDGLRGRKFEGDLVGLIIVGPISVDKAFGVSKPQTHDCGA